MEAQTTSLEKPEGFDLKAYISEVPDFPKPGILFYDISTLLRDADAWQIATSRLTRVVASWRPDVLAGVESRGFLTAAPLAQRLGCGFVMIRKPGKLPGKTLSHAYGLEYGKDELHIQVDAIKPGQRVVVLDDLLATGGTLAASVALLQQVGANVAGAAVLIELLALKGRQRQNVPVYSLLSYET